MAAGSSWARGHTTRVPLTNLTLPICYSLAPYSLSNPSVIFTKNLVLRQSRKHPKLIFCCKDDNVSNITSEEDGLSTCPSSADWDWSRWTTHFADIEQAESLASLLKFQLEEAIEKEDFREAANLKKSLGEVTEKDSIAEIMSKLKTAINDERYHDASRLCQSTGSGLIGWWVGYSKDSEDHFGKVVRITASMGRFVAKTYSPRQLVTASSGTPLFEIFVVKEADNTYTLQVAYLHQSTQGKTDISSPLDPKLMNGLSANETENDSVIDVKATELEAKKAEDKRIDFEEAAEEGIKSVINFLKKKIPELKVNMKITITDEVAEDIESMKQVMEDDNRDTVSSDESEDEVNDLDGTDEEVVAGSNNMGDEKGQDMKLLIGGLLHNKEDNPTKEEFYRIPAEIKNIERDSFMLHIPKRYQDHSSDKISVASAEVDAVSAQSFSELMPPNVVKAFLTSDKISPKVSRDIQDILKLAFKQAQKRNAISEYTTFKRIITTGGDSDPFEGLYIGAFGPYGAEVVQLRHKYGNWNSVDTDEPTNAEFYEYVEAVKLTGDLNVPAGQVTFRAKIGRVNRHSNRGKYPDELGVVASYKGEGRIADFGFKSSRWVEGELLQLNGKGLGPYVRGADLGFLYVISDQSFLVLFNRLKLPE